MATGNRWRLEHFRRELDGLPPDLPQPAGVALAKWLIELHQNPAGLSRTRIVTGPHVGETADEREPPFPPYFRSRIFEGNAGYLACEYFVNPDTWTVTCVRLRYHRLS